MERRIKELSNLPLAKSDVLRNREQQLDNPPKRFACIYKQDTTKEVNIATLPQVVCGVRIDV